MKQNQARLCVANRLVFWIILGQGFIQILLDGRLRRTQELCIERLTISRSRGQQAPGFFLVGAENNNQLIIRTVMGLAHLAQGVFLPIDDHFLQRRRSALAGADPFRERQHVLVGLFVRALARHIKQVLWRLRIGNT